MDGDRVMAASNFKTCLTFTLKYEGGYVDHPQDPGGATNLGITIGVLRNWRGEAVTKSDVRALTVDEAGRIYRARYWDTVQGDKLPPGVDLAVWDYAVNSGPARVAKALQKIVGVPQDGVIGMDTISAVHKMKPRDVINALCDERQRFVRRLGTYKSFGKGWERRILAVRQAGLSMAARIKPSERDDGPAPEKARPADLKVESTGTAKAGVVIAGGALTTGATIKTAAETITATKEVAEGATSLITTLGLYGLAVVGVAALAFGIWWLWKQRGDKAAEGDA